MYSYSLLLLFDEDHEDLGCDDIVFDSGLLSAIPWFVTEEHVASSIIICILSVIASAYDHLRFKKQVTFGKLECPFLATIIDFLINEPETKLWLIIYSIFYGRMC